jgi:proline iminopeptidase
VLSSIAAVLMMIVGLYAAYAYYAYNGIQLSERACVDCVSGVTVGGYHLYYREVGTHTSLPPVVLVHGGPGHSSLSFKNAFDFLAAERRVVYYDQRGSGNSQIKADATDYTIERLVDELEGVRRDVVKAEKIDVVGHSFGGAIAQRYALRFPDRVETLTLIGSVRINNGMSNRFVWKWFGPAMYSVELGLPATDANAWFTESANSNDAERLFDKSKASLLDGTGNLSFVPWREILLSAVGDDYAAELRELRVPTLFVYGAADSPYTGKPVADETCSIVPDCRAVGFARSGHWPFLEEPARFQQVMREFLRGH